MLRFIAPLLLVSLPPLIAADAVELVACAPGYPSTSEQAQPSMDRFAEAIERLGGLEASAVYTPSASDGVERLASAGLALVPAAFFLEYEEQLALEPLLAVSYENGLSERWALVAAKGQIDSAASLAGYKLVGLPGYSPRYVERIALDGFGALPESVTIAATKRVLSELRKASRGEQVAVLLDTAQTDALARLPFGSELEIVARSEATPGFLLCTVGDRLDAATVERLSTTLLQMHEDDGSTEALAEIRVEQFAALDAAAIERLRSRFNR